MPSGPIGSPTRIETSRPGSADGPVNPGDESHNDTARTRPWHRSKRRTTGDTGIMPKLIGQRDQGSSRLMLVASCGGHN